MITLRSTVEDSLSGLSPFSFSNMETAWLPGGLICVMRVLPVLSTFEWTPLEAGRASFFLAAPLFRTLPVSVESYLRLELLTPCERPLLDVGWRRRSILLLALF